MNKYIFNIISKSLTIRYLTIILFFVAIIAGQADAQESYITKPKSEPQGLIGSGNGGEEGRHKGQLPFDKGNLLAGKRSVAGKNWQDVGRFARFTPQQEILSQRDEFSKHFQNPDGTITAIISQGYVHYKDEAGCWQDILTDIRPNVSGTNMDYPYAITENNYKIYFHESLDDGYLLRFPAGDVCLGMSGEVRLLSGDEKLLKTLSRAPSAGDVKDNSMIFKGTYPFGYDELIVQGMGTDHDIVLNELPVFLNDAPDESFVAFREFVRLPGGWKIVAKTDFYHAASGQNADDGGLIVVDEKGNYVCEFLTPVVREKNLRVLPGSNGPKGSGDGLLEMSINRTFYLESGDGGYFIETRVPASWLKDPERIYPVIIDPTITCYPNTVHAWTGWNQSSSSCYGGLNYSGDYLYWVSNYSPCAPSAYANYNSKGFMYFNTAGIPDGSAINSTVLNYDVYSKSSGTPYYYIRGMATFETTCSGKWTCETTGMTYLDYTSCSSTGWYSHVLGSTANTDLAARLPSDFFGVAFDEYETVGCYWVRAYGWYNTSYMPYITVEYTLPCTSPSNDSCAGATSILTTPYSNSGVLGCSDDCPGGGYYDVFYYFTPTATGSYTVDMGLSTGNTFLRVFSGSCCGTLVASDDDSFGDSDPSITLTLNGGTTYYFECGSHDTSGYANSAYNLNFVRNCTTPSNETCAGATNVTYSQIAYGYNATGTLGCTDDCQGRAYHDVLYRYDCSCTGVYTFDMRNSDGDTYMRIFADTCCGTPLAEDDDTYGDFDPQITDTLTAGHTYWVECGSWSALDYMKGSLYNLYISTTCQPPCTAPSNESCSGATVISAYNTPYATAGVLGCSDDCSGYGYFDVFYSYTPLYTGSYTIDMGLSDGDTYMRIFSGSCCGTLLAEDDDSYGDFDPSITITLNGDSTYYIECGSYWTTGYAHSAYNLNLLRNCNPPINETCNGATPISFAEIVSGYNSAGTLGCTDDRPGRAYHDVFYRYDCTCTGSYTFDMGNSDGDTYMRIFADSCSGLLVDEDDDSFGGLDPLITVTLTAGKSYWIECGSWSAMDYMTATAYNLHAITTCVIPCNSPTNETCLSATYISTAPYTTSGMLGCSDDCTGAGYHDVFYYFTPYTSGWYTVDMGLSDGDTYLRVFSGSCCGTLVAENDDGFGGLDPKLTLYLSAGTNYYFECGSYSSGGYMNSAYNLNLVRTCMAPANEICSGATALTYSQIIAGYNNAGNLGCTDDCPGRGYYDVFYRYTCTCTGSYTFDMRNSDGDTYMRIFSDSCCGTEIAYNDDGYGGLDPSITITLTSGTTYWIECGSYATYDYMKGSAYNLYASTLCVLPLGCGNTYLGSIHPLSCQPAGAAYQSGTVPFWYFAANSGITYHFTLGSNPEDSYLRIYDAGGSLIAQKDDNGPFYTGYPASISWTCTTSGTYFITASNYYCDPLNNSGSMVFWSTNDPYSRSSGTTITPSANWQYQPYASDSLNWYYFSASAGTMYDFSLCANSEDSYLTIYNSLWNVNQATADDNGPYCTGFPASISWVAPATATYIIVVSGYNCSGFENAGTLAYNRHEITPVVCPSLVTIQENEPDCYNGYTDFTNGGCNSAPEAYTELTACHDVVCGKSGTYTVGGASYRDTDWYRLTLSGPATLNVKAVADFPLQLMVIDLKNGCAGQTTLGMVTAAPGDTAYLRTAYAGPGVIVYWVGPDDFSGVSCGSKYVMYCSTSDSISLISATGSDHQTLCKNTAITDIKYATTGATGAVFSGLPAGVSGTYSGGNITISGAPSVSGTFSYSVVLNGACQVTASGTITVLASPVAEAGNNITCYGTPVQIGSSSSGPGTFLWIPATGLNNPYVAQPMASPSFTTTYTLLVTYNGCTASDAVTVTYGGAGHTISGKTRYAGKADAGVYGNPPTYNPAVYNISKVLVTLKSYPAGAELARDTSDGPGMYHFSNVPDGNYIISYDKLTSDTMQWCNDANAIDVALVKYLIGADTMTDPSRCFSAKYKKAANVDDNTVVNAIDVARLKAKVGSPYNPARNFPKGNWAAFDTLVTVAGADLNITLKTISYGDYNASSIKYRDSTVSWSLVKSVPENIIVVADDYIMTSDPTYFEIPLRINTGITDFAAMGLELSYPENKYCLVSVSMPLTGNKNNTVKINPSLEEIMADEQDLLVTDEEGVIRVVYATTDYFEVGVNDEIIRLGFRSLEKMQQGEPDFGISGTGVMGNQYGAENEGAFLLMPRIFVQGNHDEAGFEFCGYPNPFNGEATLSYYLPEKATVKLNVYNAIGELVNELVNEIQPHGRHTVVFASPDLPEGMYTFRLEFSGMNVTECLVLKMIH